MDKEYKIWLINLKNKIRSAQLKASVSVNEHMILLYWEIGKSIVEKQSEQQWGSKIIKQMAKDLKNELPETNGFSRTNLFAMRQFYLFYNDFLIVHQLVGQLENDLVHHVGGLINKQSLLCKIPWRHHVAILGKCNVVLLHFIICLFYSHFS